jgi:uncharacterized protein (DUF305 family)
MQKAIIALVAVVGMGGPVFAQSHSGHSAPIGHADPAAASRNASPATAGFRAANARMHKDMDVPFTGDADADFARGMIPHHQGAVDMAKVVLQHGKDPEIRKLAEEIIAAQEKEIAFFREWLRKKGQ